MPTEEEIQLWRNALLLHISEEQVKDKLESFNIKPSPEICQAILGAAQVYIQQ